MENPSVSVVITTKNEEKNIGNCLQSILDQSYSNDKIEIIVVDNNSTDKTKEAAKKYTDKIFDKGPERSAQRNFGLMEVAKGELVMFLDADMILSKEVIKGCVLKIRQENLIALYIAEVIIGDNFWNKVRRFERSFYDATVIDCVRFLRRDKFIEVGGFDLSMTGPEDWDFDKKIRKVGKVGLVNEPIYHNEEEFSLKKYLAKKSYYAQSFSAYINKWGQNDPDVKKQLGLYYRFWGVFTEKGKWTKLLWHPILTLGLYFLRFLVGIKYLTKKDD